MRRHREGQTARNVAAFVCVGLMFAACEPGPTAPLAASPLTTLTISPNPDTIVAGTMGHLTVVGKDADGKVITATPAWSVVAGGGVIGANGLFEADTVPGTYVNTVRATIGAVSGFATITIIAAPLAKIVVTPAPVTLAENGTQQFTAVGQDANGHTVAIAPTWSVVAGGGTIGSGSGMFTAGAVAGTFANTVRATSGGVSGFATVVVTTGALASLTVSPNPANLGIGAVQQFTAVGRDAGGAVIAVSPIWSVVAGGGTIDVGGSFKAGTTPGTFTNTVRATSGSLSGTATVTVSAGAVASITITPNPAGVAINGTQQFAAVGRDGSGNIVPITPVWSTVAGGGTIGSGTGLFTAGAVGGTYLNTVRASSDGISGFATVTVNPGTLATITVTPNPANIGISATQQFTALGRDASGNMVSITPSWSIVAGGGTIGSGSGLFTAGTVPGTYTNTVQASSGGISGTATVTVSVGALATITVSPDPATVGIGSTRQFAAVGKDAFGNVVTIVPVWSTVAGGGATDVGGLFTAGTVPGTYVNTVSATSGAISGFATVTVNAGALATITVSPTTGSIGIGGAQQFTAVGNDASGNVVPITPVWAIVAGGGTADASGLFTAGSAPGTFTNTVRATSGTISGFATVNVVAGPVATITVSPLPATLSVGGVQQFTAVARDAAGNVVPFTAAWSVVAGGGAISSSGAFTAGAVPGTYINTIQVTSAGVSGFATVTVTAGALATISVTPNPASIGVGATQQFTAVGRDVSGNVVTIAPVWSVIAGGAIGATGLFTAGTVPGTYTNTVRATSGAVSGSATVTVTAGALATITVGPNSANVGVGASQPFVATGSDAFGNAVAIAATWTVVAGGGTITPEGVFTAATTPGTYTNTVQAVSGGISGFATVNVAAGPLATIVLSPDPANIGINASQAFTAVGKDAFSNVTAITPVWSVIAGGGTITGAGVFTAGTVPGTYVNTVQATSGGVSGFATVTVSAGALASITITPNPASIGINGAQAFTAVGRDASGNVVAITPTWTVVAGGGTISSAGLFTAGTVPGIYTNTVQAVSGGISGFATVTVSAGALASVTVTPNPVALGINGTQAFTAVGRDASGNVVAITAAWSVVAGGGTITAGGQFTAGTVPGTFTNTVRAASGGISGVATVTVSAGALAAITVSPDPANLGVNGVQQFTAIGTDAAGNAVPITPLWTVVASGGTIDAAGLFTAGTVPGTYSNTVRATSGAVSGSATVTVTAGALASITVTPNPATLSPTAAQTFSAVGKDASGNVVTITPTWTVVAGGGSINGAGVFTAGSASGTYTNTVRATNGAISGFATVTITAGALAAITVSPNPANLGVNGVQQFTAIGTDASGNVVAITPLWTVVASGGTIDAAGLFAAGTVPGTYSNTVRATSAGVSGLATVTVAAGTLASITVTPSPALMSIGAAQQFTAVGKDASGNVVVIAPTWSTVAGGGAINGSGLFTAGTVPGTYVNTVKAVSGGIAGFATVNVTAGALAAITVSPDPANLGVNGVQQFAAIGTDAAGNAVPITPLWTVVASGGTIDAAGLFTAGTVPGTYSNTVRATSGAVSGSATVTVTAGALASITVTPNPAVMSIGAAQQFTAVGKDASGNVVVIAPTWSVVAGGGAINGSGLFTAGTVPGTYVNTVKAVSGGITGFATVTVSAGALATITVTPNPATIGINASQTFTAVGKDASGNLVSITPTWSVVAAGGTITGGGVFTAGTVPGTYTNTVQATSGAVSGAATVTVVAGALASITITPDPATLSPTATQTFSAVGKDASGNVVTITPNWTVVAGGGSIDGAGVFTAGSAPGTYTNTVSATSGTISGFATVTITAGPLATITLTPGSVTLASAALQQFVATGRDAFGNTVVIAPVWSVVAGGGTINATGLFTAGTAPGTYTNTVRATSGAVSGSATVTVTAGALATITVSPNPANLGVGANQTFIAIGKDASGNVVTIVPTWTVVAAGGAITSAGVFTAGTVPGTYTNTIQATSGAISGFATVNVAAGALATITVTPNPASVGIGATQAFSAVGKDAFGNVVALTSTWTVVAGGGSIDAAGLFTAGTVPGTYTNTVRATSGAVSGSATVTVTASALATITVSPNPATLTVGGTQQFAAVGKDASGNVVATTITWTVVSGGGSISAGGLFTAGTVPGTYTSTVRGTGGSVSGFATVTVVAGPPATITVTPNPATVGATGTQQFTAVGTDASGNVVAIAAVWSVVAGGGSIGSGGLFTAGTVPGTYTNTVHATSGAIVGSATVVVVAGPLATITITPNPASVGTTLTQAFTAVGRDANGNVVAITPTWSVVAGGGSIDSGTGVFTAGTVPGTYANTIRASSGTIFATATVTVTVNLGSAAGFAVLGGSGASSCTGVSTISGNVGVSPLGSISGFPTPCAITAPGDGTVHLNDATSAAAQSAVTSANTTLSSMACTTDLTGQDLGGKTLAPGVYCFTSTAQLTGTLTLSGPATGIWVFRMGSTLTTAAGSAVSLVGAQAGSVYWQVGSAATLGATNLAFRGNIIAQTTITMGAGTTLNGRALAKVSVVMDTNIVTIPP